MMDLFLQSLFVLGELVYLFMQRSEGLLLEIFQVLVHPLLWSFLVPLGTTESLVG